MSNIQRIYWGTVGANKKLAVGKQYFKLEMRKIQRIYRALLEQIKKSRCIWTVTHCMRRAVAISY